MAGFTVRDNSIYRDILEMLGYFMFEYDPESDCVNFFVVSNGQNVLARSIENFTEWKDTFPEYYVPENEKASFLKMCEDIISLKNVNHAFLSSFFHKEKNEMHEYVLLSKKHVLEDGKEIAIGCVSTAKASEQSAARSSFGVAFEKDVSVDVYNKKSIFEYCKHLIEEFPKKRFYIAIFDLDNFKNINDTYGHFFGDEVLENIATVLKASVKDYGKVGRVGGDEFFIVFDEVCDRDMMKNILKDTRENVERCYQGRTGDFSLTCTAGAVPYPECGASFDEIYRMADALLYIGKEKGRNRYILYRPDLHKDILNKVIGVSEECTVEDLTKDAQMNLGCSELLEKVMKEYLVQGTMTLEDLLRLVSDEFMIDCCQVVRHDTKEGFELESGNYCDEYEKVKASDLQEDFISEFLGHKYFRVNSLSTFKNDRCSGKRFLKSKHLQTALFYILEKDGQPTGYVMFGKRRNIRRWAEHEYLALTAIAEVIGLKT